MMAASGGLRPRPLYGAGAAEGGPPNSSPARRETKEDWERLQERGRRFAGETGRLQEGERCQGRHLKVKVSKGLIRFQINIGTV